jgi:hypothetical protein
MLRVAEKWKALVQRFGSLNRCAVNHSFACWAQPELRPGYGSAHMMRRDQGGRR